MNCGNFQKIFQENFIKNALTARAFFEYGKVTGKCLVYRCLNYRTKFDEELKEKFENKFSFCIGGLNKFVFFAS